MAMFATFHPKKINIVEQGEIVTRACGVQQYGSKTRIIYARLLVQRQGVCLALEIALPRFYETNQQRLLL